MAMVLLPPFMTFSLSDFPVIEVERENHQTIRSSVCFTHRIISKLYVPCLDPRYHNAHRMLCLSHASIPVFAEPVLRAHPVTPEKILTFPALGDGGPEGERTASGYPPAFLAPRTSQSSAPLTRLRTTALKEGGALGRKFARAKGSCQGSRRLRKKLQEQRGRTGRRASNRI